MDKDALLFGTAAFGAGFIGIWFVSNVLKFFVALKEPPARRASWIVGLGYLGISTIFVLSLDMDGYEYWAPLVCFPGAFLAYWFHYRQFKFAWIESADDLPDGIDLAVDDWRVGLVRLLALVVLGLIAVGIKAVNKMYWAG